MTRKAHTYEQAAEQLGVEKTLVRELVEKGELLAFTVSNDPHARSKCISDIELDRFIAAREEQQRQKHAHLTLGPSAQRT